MADSPINPHADAWAQFKSSTANHQLTVLHDDGLYRHLRMGEPGTSMWSWNIVTWPFHLYVGGDIGEGFVFSREEDMIGFFKIGSYPDYYGDGSHWINPSYWSEKLDRACRDRAFAYDERLFMEHVTYHLTEARKEGTVGKRRAKQLWADATDAAAAEESARGWLGTLAYEDADLFADSWEWTLKGYDHHFILALYAIGATLAAYRPRKAPTPT